MIEKNGRPLKTLADWEMMAGPKSSTQWKDGRSAKESARAWLERGPAHMPAEVEATLASHRDFNQIVSWTAEPEALVPFDARGGPANIDVLVTLEDSIGYAILIVEAKADEAFGGTVTQTLAKAQRRLEANQRSRGVERLEQLANAIFGLAPSSLDDIGSLRYQLLPATAAGQAEAARLPNAQSAGRVVLLIHEFVTDQTTDSRHAANARDLNAFVARLGGSEAVSAGSIVGPFTLPSTAMIPAPVPFYVGKAVRSTRT